MRADPLAKKPLLGKVVGRSFRNCQPFGLLVAYRDGSWRILQSIKLNRSSQQVSGKTRMGLIEQTQDRAARRVQEFRDIAHDHGTSVVDESRQAMDCLECDDFLRLGVEAYRWITRVDELLRFALYRGSCDYDETVESAILGLLTEWLSQSSAAIKWASLCKAHGYKLDNEAEFLECVSAAQGALRYADRDDLPKAVAECRDQAIAEHERGETLGYFSSEE